MHTNQKATFQELKDEVHGTEVGEDAVERTIVEARKQIADAGLPVRLTVSGLLLYRTRIPDGSKPSPETTPETTPET
jgi:hypothetical protein